MTITGLYVPLVTPFDDVGAPDRTALAALACDVLDAGASGLVALGTTGEPAALTPAERTLVVDLLAEICQDRGAGLIVGAHDATALGELAGRPAVVAALTLVPPFLRPGEAGVLAHLAALAEPSPVPLIVYHVPYRTGQSLSGSALRRLADIPGVAGIKLAPGGIDAATVELMADLPAGFAVLGGDDPYISPLLALGAHGAVLASAHLATAEFADLITAWRTGDAVRGRALGHRLAPLSLAVFAEPNPAVVKGVLHAQGRIASPAVRLPLLPATAASIHAALTLLPG
jgi:4-hydroxy-tetrahydrodipicolinate synthase